MSKYILTPLALEVEIRQWAVQRGLNSKIHLAVDAHGMPVRFFVTSGTTADCIIAAQLIEGFQAEYLSQQIRKEQADLLKTEVSSDWHTGT